MSIIKRYLMKFHCMKAVDLFKLAEESNKLDKEEKKNIFNHLVKSLLNAEYLLRKDRGDKEALEYKKRCFEMTNGSWADEVRSSFLIN